MKDFKVFDDLCNRLEKHIPGWIPVLHVTKVFHFDEDHFKKPEKIKDFDWAWGEENLHLPFKSTGMVFEKKVIILIDLEDNQFGLKEDRGFIYYALTDGVAYMENHKVFSIVSSGTIRNIQPVDAEDYASFIDSGFVDELYRLKTPFAARSEIDDTYVFTEDGFMMSYVDDEQMAIVSPEDFEKLKHYRRTVINEVVTAISHIFILNRPNNFILEEKPLGVKPKVNKILRLSKRPKYTLITPNAIRKKCGWKPPQGLHQKIPHERRGHPRVFRDERYKNMKGKEIWIKATWIGQSSGKVGNKFYRVLLDK